MTKACADAAVKLVKFKAMESQVIWIAFNYEVCLYIKSLLPAAHVQYLCSAESSLVTPETIAAKGLDGIDYSNALMTTRLDWIDRCHDKGVVANVWTVDSSVDMLRYAGAGCDFITTNYPDTLIDLLKQRYVE